jgi:hypothetical protein
MYYKNSGRFSFGGLLIAVATGLAASLILAYAYGRGIISINEVHFAFFATTAFGALIGVATGYGLIWGKVRNDQVGMVTAGAVSAVALYLSWAVWVAFTLQNSNIDADWTVLAQRPGKLWNVICLINQHGTWGLSSGSTTNGWELWVVWLLEAALVIGVAVFSGLGVLSHRPFCESCEVWAKRGAKMVLAAPQNLSQLKLQLEANDFRSIESLGPGNKAATHLVAVLDSCERCRQFHTMSLTLVTIGRTKLGKPTVQTKMVMQQLLLGPGHAETLRQISMKVVEAAKLQPPKANATAAGKR